MSKNDDEEREVIDGNMTLADFCAVFTNHMSDNETPEYPFQIMDKAGQLASFVIVYLGSEEPTKQ